MEIGLEWGAPRICTRAYFLVYINDLEAGVTCTILKFADNTKLFRKTKDIGDKQQLQDGIDKLVRRSEKCRCYSILENLNVCTQGLEILADNMKWEELFKVKPGRKKT